MTDSLELLLTSIRDSVVTTRDAAGAALCECGARLAGAEFLCSTCSRRRATDQASRGRAERDERWRAEINGWAPLAGVPEWAWARVDGPAGEGNPDFTRRIRFPRFLAFAQVYLPVHGSVLLSADTGEGKTALTCAMLHRLRDAETARLLASKPGSRPSAILWTLRDLVWTTGFDLAKARRENSLGDGEARLVERAMSCKLLVLDEVGFEVQHDTVIQEIANARYVGERPTIITTGLHPDGFAKRYGDACYRRFTERGLVVEGW